MRLKHVEQEIHVNYHCARAYSTVARLLFLGGSLRYSRGRDRKNLAKNIFLTIFKGPDKQQIIHANSCREIQKMFYPMISVSWYKSACNLQSLKFLKYSPVLSNQLSHTSCRAPRGVRWPMLVRWPSVVTWPFLLRWPIWREEEKSLGTEMKHHD